MKVGLISYHSEPNYGTMLQAYALSKALNQLGVENEYIQYRSSPKRSILFRALRALVRSIIPAVPSSFSFFGEEDFISTLNSFKKFHTNYIPVSKSIYYTNTIKTANSRYDLFIVGSDQTWSEHMNRSGNTANFLSFVSDPSKKNSYAPSIGSLVLSDNYSERLKANLQSFHHLSCREKPNCEKLTSLLKKKVEYVLDPTLLFTSREWDEVATKPTLTPPKYILAYILGEKACISEYAESLGRVTGLPVYYILTRPLYLSKRNCLKGIGPSDFIGLIRGASYVVTDSFHGTAFCLIYGIQVYCFTKRVADSGDNVWDNDRIKLLLSEFGLENRVKDDDDTSFEADYVQEQYLDHLELLRQSSLNYLKRIVSE